MRASERSVEVRKKARVEAKVSKKIVCSMLRASRMCICGDRGFRDQSVVSCRSHRRSVVPKRRLNTQRQQDLKSSATSSGHTVGSAK